MTRMSRPLVVLALLLIIVILPVQLSSTYAQNTVTLSLAVPSQQADMFNDKLIAAFETENPGVRLTVVKADPRIPFAAQGLASHLDAVADYVQTADVLTTDLLTISPEATDAGYFLDLAPLVATDTTLNPDDFFPAAWNSFQWNKAIWALPTSVDALVLSYQPEAFDKAGLPYPSAAWTLDDMESAVRSLAVKGSDGQITQAGIDVVPYLLPYLLRMANSEKLYDGSTIPNTPRLDTPRNRELLERWLKLDSEGYVGQEFSKSPLEISAAATIPLSSSADSKASKRVGSLIFGTAGLIPQGFAVSVGTQHPELAYKLAAWLTTRAELINTAFASTPARQSLLGQQGAESTIKLNIPADLQQLITQAMEKGLSLNELRYADYLGVAYAAMKNDQLDASTALQKAESSAIKAQQDALAYRDKINVVVATAVPGNQTTGKVTIRFAVNTANPIFPNKEKWDQAVAKFIESDHEVGTVVLGTMFDGVQKIANKYDCFYLPFNAAQGSTFTALLPLDPYLMADSTFDKSDLLSNLYDSVIRDGKVYGLPVDIQPNLLKYNTQEFSNAGLTVPDDGWTIDGFVDALKQLKTDAKDAPFVPANTLGAYILSLVAAYGGMPLDYRTYPPTINFTDPKTVDAIRQVLDLAKQGYFKYSNLGGQFFDINPFVAPSPIAHESIGAFTFRFSPLITNDPKFSFTMYPKGNEFTAITYNVGILYISAETDKQDACYRFISAASRNPTLFSAMPTRRSVLDDPALITAQGEDIVKLYREFGTLMQDPTVVTIPMLSMYDRSNNSLLYNIWLYRALDAYMSKNADLEVQVEDAALKASTFQGCQGGLPPFDQSTAEAEKTYYRALRDCALKADPSLKPLYDMLNLD